jgi:hypothetical protein
MKEKFEDFNFRPPTVALINQANVIIEEYRDQGFVLTLRQLYYQFVARDLIKNNQKSYKRLGEVIKKGRLGGFINWRAIEDRTRSLERRSFWESPADYIMADQMHIDLWENQPWRPEVWIEKDALTGVIEDICTELDVPYFSCRGYTSLSEVWTAGKRFEKYIELGQAPIIFHLGDHDPSGIDMTRDNQARVSTFAWDEVRVDRLALNMKQVEQYDPPPNYAKDTDSRYDAYCDRFDTEDCWELDALEPSVICELIRDAVAGIRNEDQWDEDCETEEAMRSRLRDIEAGLREEYSESHDD